MIRFDLKTSKMQIIRGSILFPSHCNKKNPCRLSLSPLPLSPVTLSASCTLALPSSLCLPFPFFSSHHLPFLSLSPSIPPSLLLILSLSVYASIIFPYHGANWICFINCVIWMLTGCFCSLFIATIQRKIFPIKSIRGPYFSSNHKFRYKMYFGRHQHSNSQIPTICSRKPNRNLSFTITVSVVIVCICFWRY